MGDEVAARHESEPSGEVEWKPVEACFRRTGRVLHLHFPNGELIRTTPEHPFFVESEGKGWTQAGSLKAGDRLITLIGDSIPIHEVYDTEEWENVYNIRVADFHTYFVGDECWSVWAHNLYSSAIQALLDARHNAPTAALYTSCNDLLDAPNLTQLLKWEQARKRVIQMTDSDFKHKLQKAMISDGLLKSNAELQDATAKRVKAALEQYGSREPAPTTPRPTSDTVNPYNQTTQEAHYRVFQRDVIEGKERNGLYKTMYHDIVALINSTAVHVHAERLILMLPAGQHDDRIAGLEYQLQRTMTYASSGELAGVEFVVGSGAKEVDILLSNGTMIDTKDWNAAFIAKLDLTTKSAERKKYENYLRAQPTRTLQLEFSTQVPQFVVDLMAEWDADTNSPFKDRLKAVVRPKT